MSSDNLSRLKALFRVDASPAIGSGHLVRCLTLAGYLRERGFSVAFACAALPAPISALIKKERFELITVARGSAMPGAGNLEQPLSDLEQQSDAAALIDTGQVDGSDWLIVDHYGLDERWEQQIRSRCERMMVIDDLANRRHVCDLLLDQNPGDNKREQYQCLTQPDVRLLLGPEYALLRDEFAAARAGSEPRRGEISRVMVSFGGVDATNETAKAVRALRRIPGLPGGIDVVAGAANPHAEALKTICLEDDRVRFHRSVSNMAELMSLADVAIGACGATSWERCAVYLPAIAVVVADNQREIAQALTRTGAANVIGWHSEVSDQDLESAIADLCHSPGRVHDLSRAAGAMVDARGTQRVFREMEDVYASARLLH